MKLESLPLNIIDTLNTNGFEAYAVGGCVRDFLLCRKINDYDICTSAMPSEICALFEKTKDQGLRFGTVLVCGENESVEVTTFRTEGEYIDNRRPENVEFVKKLDQDLSRRDFTINAMAYHPKKGIIDLFCGKEDIKNKLVRCVGDAKVRFSEDALRILRTMRFASVLNFSVEEETEKAMFLHKDLLKNVSKERITEEFYKLLGGVSAGYIINRYADIIRVFMQDFSLPDSDFDALPNDSDMRFAFLIKDLKNKAEALNNFRLKKVTLQKIIALSENYKKNTEPFFLLQSYPEEFVFEIFKMNKNEEFLEAFFKKTPCYKIEHLKICGTDLKELGILGKKIKEVQNELLKKVVFENMKNEKNVLLDFCRENFIK